MDDKQEQELHEAIERRVLGPNRVGMILDDGRLVLIAHDKGVQMVLDAAASSNLLDLLSAHKTLLQQISQGQDQPTAPSLHAAKDGSNPTIEFELPPDEEQPGP